MSKYIIDSSTLVSIADAIRTKEGSTGVIQVSDFPARISAIEGGGGGGTGEIDVKAILEDADKLDYINYGGLLDKYYTGNKITLLLKNHVSSNGISNMFRESTVADEMDITIDGSNFSNGSSPFSYFLYNSDIKKLNLHMQNMPAGYQMRQVDNFCGSCKQLEEVNDDIFDFIDELAPGKTPTSANPTVFQSCYNLKKFPDVSKLLINTTSTITYWGLQYLMRLESLSIPICSNTNPAKLIAYQSDFLNMYMLKHLIFTNPKNIVWTGAASTSASYRKLRLSQYMGYCSTTYLTQVNDIQNGTLKEVTDDATYQQYKNSGYYTKNAKYSHYDKLSAIETLNSLPDVSAIGGTWTVEFRGDNGELTDGGAINTMTEAEMAGAVAKGWTITFT